MYNAIAGSCAEDEANAGGGGGGGSPPAGITLNQFYFSDSATSGAGAGVIVELYLNNQFLNFFVNPMTRSYGTGVSLASALSTPTISALSTQETKSAYTLSASTLIAFLNTAQTGQTNPYTNSNEPSQIFFNIGMFLQAPNGFNNMTQYEIVAATINWGGVMTFFGNGSFVTPNFPQQNSLAISTDYPSVTNANFNPSTGNSSDWGICGNSGVLTLNFLSGFNITILQLADMRARMGTAPSAGQTATFRYKAKAVNSSGTTVEAFHTIEITLT